jgi:hypothetical protein
MKKTIFSIFVLTLVALFATLFVSCPLNLPDKSDDDSNVDVIYSVDWKYISIYLDNVGVPITINMDKKAQAEKARSESARAEARAMTPDTARRGFDYFEVFFYYQGTVARSSWEVGKRASIMDVYRTDSGVDYSATSLLKIKDGGNSVSTDKSVSAVGSPDSPVGVPGAAAVLFAGRKNDRSLLAVGKLISVDKEEPAGDSQNRSTLIKSGTTYVTFELSALTANTSADITKSSFLTDNSGSGVPGPEKEKTRVISALLGDKYFPLYILPPGKGNINAQYYFDIDGDWSDFEGSIVVTEAGDVDIRQARYPAGSGKYWYAKYGEDQTTVVKMTNNQAVAEFKNPITFLIDTSKTNNPIKPDNGIFTFAFSIPVCPFSTAIQKNEADCWFVRPAYTSYYYNIDNGITDGKYSDKNIGGAVLCAVDLQAVNFEIPVERR